MAKNIRRAVTLTVQPLQNHHRRLRTVKEEGKGNDRRTKRTANADETVRTHLQNLVLVAVLASPSLPSVVLGHNG